MDNALENNERIQKLVACYRAALLESCLPFWFPRCIDLEQGGYLHCFDRDGSLIDSDKSVWAQGRMAWMLLTLYREVEPREEWLRWAEHGLAFLDRYAFDPDDRDGRMFFQLTRDGRPLRKRRYAFSECFAAIAFAAHARVRGDERSRERAIELFRLFVDWNFTPGRMPPKYTATRPMLGLSPRLMTLVTAQELRRHLGESNEWDCWIDQSIREIREWFVKPDLKCVMETVGPEGEIIDHADGRTLNPGHAIEGAWFILEEAEHRGDRELTKLGCQMLDWMWERGWDQTYGGLFYFRDLDDRPVAEYWHDMKFWWPHDEALIATLMAYRMTRDAKYLEWHERLREWSFSHFEDREYGDWYGYLHRDGSLSNTLKGSLWKSCFHHPRAMLRCWKMAESIGVTG